MIMSCHKKKKIKITVSKLREAFPEIEGRLECLTKNKISRRVRGITDLGNT